MDPDAATTLVVAKQRARGRVDLRATPGGIQVQLWVQPELWPGRRIGKFTPEEHQQLTLGICTFGRSWERIQEVHVPSRSVEEARSAPSCERAPGRGTRRHSTWQVQAYAERKLQHVRAGPQQPRLTSPEHAAILRRCGRAYPAASRRIR